MHVLRRLRTPVLLCSFAVLACALVSRPFVNMGIADDYPYILMAQKLATTGHIVYNSGETAMLVSQVCLGAAFIKLFGFSLTAVRMSTVLVAMALAFLLQRTLVRAGISEWNATIATLALVLSPLYLMLSVTFMSDVQGLFAIVLCLYSCLRALQAGTPRAARMVVPANAYVAVHLPIDTTCEMHWYAKTPHIHPQYAVSFQPDRCYGPAPFAPVRYSRWLASTSGTLYVVNFIAPRRP